MVVVVVVTVAYWNIVYSFVCVCVSLSLSLYRIYLSYAGSSPSQSVALASALTALSSTHATIQPVKDDNLGERKLSFVLQPSINAFG